VTSAFNAIRCVPPRSDHTAVICCENDRKALGRRVGLKFEVRAPWRRGGSMPSLDVIKNTSEAHPLGIKDPGAVTRFHDGGRHASRMPGQPGTQYRGAWQSPWNWVTVPLRSAAEAHGWPSTAHVRDGWEMRIAPPTPKFCALCQRAPVRRDGGTVHHHGDSVLPNPTRQNRGPSIPVDCQSTT
jgi:hypothetical protein